MCEWLKHLTRKVRSPVKTRAQRFESSHHRHCIGRAPWEPCTNFVAIAMDHASPQAPSYAVCFLGSAGQVASPPRLKRAILRDVSVQLAPLPPVRRDGRVRLKALAPKARAPSGAAGSNPRSLRQFVHVRQIRLAAAVRKTAAQLGEGGSNPLTCTRPLYDS